MKFLKADTDIKLLVLILVVLTVFVGSNVYYQNRMNIIQAEYGKKLKHLEQIEEELLLKEKKLNEVSESEELLKKDKEVLEIGFLSLQDENKDLKTEKSDSLDSSESKPFGKTLCKATGNVVCLN